MYFISPWLGESLAFVTGVVTIFFLVRSNELRQNIWQFLIVYEAGILRARLMIWLMRLEFELKRMSVFWLQH